MQQAKLKPILFSIIKHSTPDQLRAQLPKDIISGIVVAVVALPLSIALAIVFDLVFAIGVGMLITVVLFMKMVSEETEVKGWKYYCDADSEVTHLRELPKSVRVYEINGPMFFGMTDRITDISVKEFTKYLIIRMRGVPSLDSSGMNALENLYDYCTENGVKLIFSHANEQPMKTMRHAGFVDLVGEEHFRANIDDAIAHARELLEAEEAGGRWPRGRRADFGWAGAIRWRPFAA